MAEKAARLLVAESPDILRKIAAALEAHDVTAVRGAQAAKEALGECGFDMIILGAHMDQGAMLEMLRFSASHEGCRATPIVCIRTKSLWSPLPGLASTTKALGADALIDFSNYSSESAALDGLASLVNDFLRCRRMDPLKQLDCSLETAIAHFGADFGNVQLYDSERRTLRIVAHRNFPEEFMTYFERVAEDQAGCGTAMKRRQRVVVGDVATDPIFADTQARKVLLDSGIQAFHSTPLFVRPARLRGMLSLHYRRMQRPDERQFAFSDILGRRMAGALSTMQ